MNLSLGEYKSLVAKGFRGAGYSWGLTEEASFAARALAESGLPSGEVVVRLLARADDVEISRLMPNADWEPLGDWSCPICVGASIADDGGVGTVVIRLVVEPLLLAPFLQLTLRDSGFETYAIAWDGGECIVSDATFTVAGDRPKKPTDVRITRHFEPTEPQATSGRPIRVELDEATYSELERFAHRVYAPATEASRASGAGAGTTDND